MNDLKIWTRAIALLVAPVICAVAIGQEEKPAAADKGSSGEKKQPVVVRVGEDGKVSVESDDPQAAQKVLNAVEDVGDQIRKDTRGPRTPHLLTVAYADITEVADIIRVVFNASVVGLSEEDTGGPTTEVKDPRVEVLVDQPRKQLLIVCDEDDFYEIRGLIAQREALAFRSNKLEVEVPQGTPASKVKVPKMFVTVSGASDVSPFWVPPAPAVTASSGGSTRSGGDRGGATSSRFGSGGGDPRSRFGSGGSRFGSGGGDPRSRFGSGGGDPRSRFGSSGRSGR